MTTFNPSVDTTFFPSQSGINNFAARAELRGLKGRIYNWAGSIDRTFKYQPEAGSLCLSEEAFPLDLGPDVTVLPTSVFDLRNDCGSPSTIDLGPL